MYGSFRKLSDEELAKAVRLDPSQIANLGPSIDFLKALLEERKRKILERYETDHVRKLAARQFDKSARRGTPPNELSGLYRKAVQSEQIYLLESLWYRIQDDHHPFARQLVHIIESLGEKYQIEELASKYHFTGNERLTIEKGLEVKKELEKIDELLKQLEEAAKTAQIGLIDMEALKEFAEPGDMAGLEELRRDIENYMRELAERQGLDRDGQGNFRLTPQAYKIFQGKLLDRIFSQLQASRSGRHGGRIVGDGSVELPSTKGYEFGIRWRIGIRLRRSSMPCCAWWGGRIATS